MAPLPPLRLKVLEFNIEYGGVHVSFDKVVEAIRRSGADLVAIEEAQGHTLALRSPLGWPYASGRLQVLSKYPLIDPPARSAHHGADVRRLHDRTITRTKGATDG